MTKRTFFRTLVQIEILHESPVDWSTIHDIGDGISDPLLDFISEEITSGHHSGDIRIVEGNEKVDGASIVYLLKRQGTDPDFFMLTDNAEDIEEETLGA